MAPRVRSRSPRRERVHALLQELSWLVGQIDAVMLKLENDLILEGGERCRLCNAPLRDVGEAEGGVYGNCYDAAHGGRGVQE